MINHRRVTLPQIDDIGDFRLWLNVHHIPNHTGIELPWNLKPTQLHPDEFNPARFNPRSLSEPVVITDDEYIIDGHHRVAAAKRYGAYNRTLVIDEPFTEDLVAVLNRYPGTKHLGRTT